MLKAFKVIAFVLVAAVSLIAGCILAEQLWHVVHHRYDRANTGWYHGFVQARFSSVTESVYTFTFEGQTESHWYWARPTNFTYRTLDFDYDSYAVAPALDQGSGTLSLPSLAYHSTRGTGVLTPAILREWLIGPGNTNKQDLQSVNLVFNYLKAAGTGTLPRPRHHGHYVEQPITISLEHFLLGRGVGVFVYIWIVFWAILCVRTGRKLFRSGEGQPLAQARI